MMTLFNLDDPGLVILPTYRLMRGLDKLESISSSPFSQENNISYIRNLKQGLKNVIERAFQMIFLLRSTSLDQIREVVENEELMPHKSTDFFSKLKSGLVMNLLDE